MEKINFNRSWEFTLGINLEENSEFGISKITSASGGASRYYDYNNWEKIDLPHDWAVSLPYDERATNFYGSKPTTSLHRYMRNGRREGLKTCNIGWYRKQFIVPLEWADKRIFVEFEGVYRDATIWVNGVYLDRHFSGYTSFTLEITDFLLVGEENSIALRVDSEMVEGWWYEGAGIYRNVNLYIAEPIYLKRNKTFIKTNNNGQVFVSADMVNDEATLKDTEILFSVTKEGETVAQKSVEVQLLPYSDKNIETIIYVDSPILWDIDNPQLYTLEVVIGNEVEKIQFGFREIEFDVNEGFFLNGKSLKLRGACNHQDFGGVGVAVPDNLIYYKIAKLKEMGCNAYRSSHHAPSPVLLKACDELGMLVMDETRMFGTSDEALRQLISLVERDRNHPSVFIWCLGNEEFAIQDEEWSARLMEKATRIVKSLDDTRPVVYGGNNGDNFIGANRTSEIRGVNYIRNKGRIAEYEHWLDQYHFDHPEQAIIGTEESSYVLSRGGIENDLGSGRIDSTGTVTMAWGSSPKGWVKFMETRPYYSGGFMWTGFDYHGEPNPFYTSNVSSSFGTIDLCGIEKPPFYYYKAWWTDEPVLKLTPHWNGKKGENIIIAVMTNCEKITLLLNGKTIEERKIERYDMPVFTLPFEKGTLSVEGVRNGEIYYDEIRTSGRTDFVEVTPVVIGKTIDDVSVYEINAFDRNGEHNPTANDEVSIVVSGGKLVGVENGNPADYDYEQKKAYRKKHNYSSLQLR